MEREAKRKVIMAKEVGFCFGVKRAINLTKQALEERQDVFILGDLVHNQPREEQAATLPESADVVRLMTIHQAKGLEFPVVVVPDLAAVSGAPFRPVVLLRSPSAFA